VEWVKGRFKEMLFGGLAQCGNEQEKYEYLRSAKLKFDFPHGQVDLEVRELFKNTLNEMASNRKTKKCVDKVKDDKNIFKSWDQVDKKQFFSALNKFTQDIAKKAKEIPVFFSQNLKFSVESIDGKIKLRCSAKEWPDDVLDEYDSSPIGEALENTPVV
jgi:hypothetical protein